MKKLLTRKEALLISVFIIGVFHLFFIVLSKIALFIPQNHRFFGELPFANFDGVYYILISQNGYGAYQQAFFPLFPILTRVVTDALHTSAIGSALFIVNVSLFTFLYMFMRLVSLDFGKKVAIWSTVFYLIFPTSFFLFAVYTESLFLALVISSLYFMRKGNILAASVLGGFASATRLVGVILFPIFIVKLFIDYKKQEKHNTKELIKMILPLFAIPLGLATYMAFLYLKFGDALLFMHVQPAFGAGRSGGQIVLLPQVFWRYFRILTTISYFSLDFYIAVIELFIFVLCLVVLYFAWRKKINFGYILFSLFSILLPTLSGTLSSMPRYVLAAFTVFIFFGSIKSNLIKSVLLFFFLVLQIVLSILFFSGYFVS